MKLRADISPCSADITDVAAYILAEKGFESFEPDETGLTAYIPLKDWHDDVQLELPFENVEVRLTSELVKGQDWNKEWEQHYFKPIVINGKCAIHSSFHTDVPKCEYDIVIDPKMAFGTGHHATTSMITEYLLEMDLNGKTVVDMGTGTGILAILAAMRGASQVTGIEIDPPAWENAVDNKRINGHDEIAMLLGDATRLEGLQGTADLFLANINRNVITGDLPAYAATLHRGGEMLLSGFYEKDIPVVLDAAESCGMQLIDNKINNDWTCIHLRLE
ncbi:MAG: 50S ribosomal protein L11 methyltransferase [Muribaculaceae bacterium]|nr:50S ribosomal protein L11 methyltransferase [Muribaculaceae bacterium]